MIDIRATSPLEGQLEQFSALWDLDLPNFVRDALGDGEVCVLGLGLKEEPLDLFDWHRHLVANHIADPGVVRLDGG
jgi:hypothetical protein